MHSIKNQGPFQGETKSALKSNGHFCFGKLFDVVELGMKSVLGFPMDTLKKLKKNKTQGNNSSKKLNILANFVLIYSSKTAIV